MPYHTCHAKPHHTIPYIPHNTAHYHTIPTILHSIRTIPYHTIPYHTHLTLPDPQERAGYRSTTLSTRCRAPPAPPERPRLSEKGIRNPYYVHGFVPLPPPQGGPA
eukprot:1102204-Pyramimonas_sp.AAC.1